MSGRCIAWLLCCGALLWQGCDLGGLAPGTPGPGGNGDGSGSGGGYVEVTRSLLVPAAASPEPAGDPGVLALQALLDAPPTTADAIADALAAFSQTCEQHPNDAAAQTGLAYLQLIAASHNFGFVTGLDWLPIAPDPFDVTANLREEPAVLGDATCALAPAVPPPLRTLNLLWPELPPANEGLDEAQAALATELLPLLGGSGDSTGALERFCALGSAEGALFRVHLVTSGRAGTVEMTGGDMGVVAAGLLAARAVAMAAISRSLDNPGFDRSRALADRDADADERLSHDEYLPAFPFMALHLSGEDAPNGSVCLGAARVSIVRAADRLDAVLAGTPPKRSLVAFLGDLSSVHCEWAARRSLVSGPVVADLVVAKADGASNAEAQPVTVNAGELFLDGEENPSAVAPTLTMDVGNGAPLAAHVDEWADPTLSGLVPDGLMSAVLDPEATGLRVTYRADGCELVLVDAPTCLEDSVGADRATLSGYVWLDLYGPALILSPDPPDDLGGVLSNLDVRFEDTLGHNKAVVSQSRWQMRFVGARGSERLGKLRFTGPTGRILHQASRVSLPIGEDTVWPSEAVRIPIDLGSGGLGVIVRSCD